MDRQIESFRRRNSAEQTVAIKVFPANPIDSAPEIRLALKEVLGFQRHFFGSFGEPKLLLFIHEGPVSEVVERLSIGEVLRVSEADRTIEFRIDPLAP